MVMEIPCHRTDVLARRARHEWVDVARLVLATGSPHDNFCFRRGEFNERVASVWRAVVVVLAKEEAELEVVLEVTGAGRGGAVTTGPRGTGYSRFVCSGEGEDQVERARVGLVPTHQQIT